MRNPVFPLPSLLGTRVSLREVFHELELFRKGIPEGPDYPTPVPLHFAESDAVRKLVRTYVHDIDASGLVPIQPEEDDFRDIGTAWALVTEMEPEPSRHRFVYALLFTLFAKATLGTWLIPQFTVAELLELYDGRNHDLLASLPTIGEVFKQLWPRVYPEQSSASERVKEEMSDSPHVRSLPLARLVSLLTSSPPTQSHSTSLRIQAQDEGSQSEESDQDAEASGGDDDVLMEQDPAMAPSSRPVTSKPGLADVQIQLKGLDIDEIDVPMDDQVLVSGKCRFENAVGIPQLTHSLHP